MEVDPSTGGKYTLRTKSLMKRFESEKTRQSAKKKEPKEKQRPPPLSKYRRKTANARERNRMREINEAFETLQKTLPDLPGVDAEKLTKITVLKLAVNYIKILSCVKDADMFGDKDIDELRDLWCLKNAHMAKPDHCVKPVIKPTKISDVSSTTQNKPLKAFNTKPKYIKTKSLPVCRPVNETTKDKLQNTGKKKPSKSRTRGKVCKTASVATSNGAYITLKNVAFHCTPNRKGHLDDKPLMMSMTVKRPRLEQVSFKKPSKLPRYNPPTPTLKPKIEKPDYNISNTNSTINFNPAIPYAENIPPSYNRFTPVPPLYDSVATHVNENCNDNFNININNNIVVNNSNNFLSSVPVYNIDRTVVRNDVILEFPHHRKLSDVSPLDSIFCNDAVSLPSSPKSPSTQSIVSNGTYSPDSLCSRQVLSPYSYSDSDGSCFTPSMELDSLLGSESFEEELEYITSSLVENDEALNMLLANQPSNLLSSDISDYQ